MTAISLLSSALRNILADLVLLDGEHRPETAEAYLSLLHTRLESAPNDQELLRESLTRALADRTYLTSYLGYLDHLQFSRPRPAHVLAEERRQQVLQHGLVGLPPGELGYLAVSPHQLLDLWQTLVDEFSPYWSTAVERAMEQAAREAGTRRRHIGELVQLAREQVRRTPRTDAAGVLVAAFDVRTAEPPPMASTPVRWQIQVPLAEAEWLSSDDPEEVALASSKAVTVDFSWWPDQTPPVLEVRFLAGPIMLGSADCSARLLDAAGTALAQATVRDRKLTFTAVPPISGNPLALECDYWRKGLYRLRFRTPVSMQHGV